MATRSSLALAAALLAALALCGCGSPEEEAGPQAGLTNRVMVTVNGVPIMSDTLDMMVATWGEEYERQHERVDYALLKKMRTEKLEQLINQEVIKQRLKESGITASDEEVKAAVSKMIDDLGGADEFLNYLQERGYVTFEQLEADVREDLRAQKAFIRDMRLKEPTEEELREYYRKYLAAMVVPERIWLSHIQVSLDRHLLPDGSAEVYADEYLRYIKAQIEAGYIKFGKAARDYSECRSAQHDGMVGELRKGDVLSMPQVIHDAAFALGVSNVSDVVVSDLGAHLLYVTRREPCYTNTFEDAREVLKAYLNRDILERNRYDWLVFLRNRADIHYVEVP